MVNRRQVLATIGGAVALPLVPFSSFLVEGKEENQSQLPILESVNSLFKKIETKPEDFAGEFYTAAPNREASSRHIIYRSPYSVVSICIPSPFIALILKFTPKTGIENECLSLILAASSIKKPLLSKVVFGIVNPDSQIKSKYNFPIFAYSRHVDNLDGKMILIHEGYKENFVMPYDSEGRAGFAILDDNLVSMLNI